MSRLRRRKNKAFWLGWVLFCVFFAAAVVLGSPILGLAGAVSLLLLEY